MDIRPYRKLIAWQEGHRLCVRTYESTRSFPSDERFGLISQMRKSSASVPTNIAEGNARRTNKDKIHFLNISLASLEELHYQYLLARDLSYITEETYLEMNNHIQRVGYLTGKLRQSLL